MVERRTARSAAREMSIGEIELYNSRRLMTFRVFREPQFSTTLKRRAAGWIHRIVHSRV
jgi:hypothetical protein